MHPVNAIHDALAELSPGTIDDLVRAIHQHTPYEMVAAGSTEKSRNDLAATERLLDEHRGSHADVVDDGIRPPFVHVSWAAEWWCIVGRLVPTSGQPYRRELVEYFDPRSPIALVNRKGPLISHGAEVVRLAAQIFERSTAFDLAKNLTRS